MSTSERAVHDVGGLPGGEIDRTEAAQTLFEKRVDAMLMLLTHPNIGAFKVDALRRAVESNTAQDYADLGYYAKWVRAIRTLLVEQAVVTDAEIEAKLAAVRKRLEVGHA